MPDLRWSFRPDGDRESTVRAAAQCFAGLVGRRLHIRVTSRPWSAEGWRAEMAGHAISPLPAWGAHLDREVAYLSDLALSDKLVFVGVSLTRPMVGVAARILGSREQERLAEEIAEVDRVMTAPGLGARPAEQIEMEWLLRRSIALGCPPPPARPEVRGAWSETDIAELSESVRVFMEEPYAHSVTVVPNDLDMAPTPTYVTVLTLGRVGRLDPGWLAITDRLGFPVEVSVIVDVLPDVAVSSKVQSAISRVKHQTDEYTKQRRPPPHSLARAQARALQLQDEVERPLTGEATRAYTWVRWAVPGASPQQAEDRARRLKALYKTATVMIPSDQYRMAGEFFPAEPLANIAFRRVWPVLTVAGGVPHSSKHVGHRSGFVLGHTSDGATRRAVLWDMHRSMEVRERSGVTLVSGQPGAGKSALLGKLAVNSVLGGVYTWILDPAARLAALCDIPAIKRRSRHIDLLSAQPGILSTYRVIPEPVRSRFSSDEEFNHALAMAQASRRQRTIDVLLLFLPAVYNDKQTLGVLTKATNALPAFPQNSAREVIAQLRSIGGYAEEVGEMLEQVSMLPAAQLVFPSGYGIDARGDDDDSLLTVLSMKGLVFPNEGAMVADWTSDERHSMALLSQAAWLTQRSVHTMPRSVRKTVILDEGHHIDRAASGRLFLNTAGRESRANNERLIIASQGAGDMAASFGGADLIDSVFVGRTEANRVSEGAADHQRAALATLGVPLGVGFERVLGELSPHARHAEGRSGSRDFIWSDGEGGIEKIVVDLSDLPDNVRRVLDTTAAPRQAPKVRRRAAEVA